MRIAAVVGFGVAIDPVRRCLLVTQLPQQVC